MLYKGFPGWLVRCSLCIGGAPASISQAHKTGYSQFMNDQPSGKIFRITSVDPLFEADKINHFRIRVVQNRLLGGYAVAAIRCEDQQEVHWLSTSASTPLEAVKMMLDGFELSQAASETALRVIAGLLTEGKVVVREFSSRAA